MSRFTGLLLVVFLTVSSFSAHAGMAMAVADASQAAHRQMPDHDHSKMLAMAPNDLMDTEDSGHLSNCSLGHCAIGCAGILSEFSFTASDISISSDHWARNYQLIGEATAFEPPPPKV